MFDRVLIISPHTDDGELGCGGSIARFIDEGKEVYYSALSTCEKSVPEGYPKDTLRREVEDALDVLRLPRSNRFIYSYENRIFPMINHDIFKTLEELRREIGPDIIFIPSRQDTHQDHSTTFHESLRAFRRGFSSILSYELPWNNLSFHTSFFLKLEEEHITRKVDALKCYKTQADKRYFSEKFIRSIAEARATQIDTSYAEAFEAIKIIY